MNTPKATLRECANTILDKALTAVKPHKLIPNMVRLSGELLTVGKQQFDLHRYENLYVIGAGKPPDIWLRRWKRYWGIKYQMAWLL